MYKVKLNVLVECSSSEIVEYFDFEQLSDAISKINYLIEENFSSLSFNCQFGASFKANLGSGNNMVVVEVLSANGSEIEELLINIVKGQVKAS